MKYRLTVVGVRNYCPEGEAGLAELFGRLPVGTVVYLRRVPTGERFAGSLSVMDDCHRQIGSITKTERRYIDLDVKDDRLFPVTVCGHSHEHHCMYVMAENVSGVKDPYIREVQMEEGETAFGITEHDRMLDVLTQMMLTKIDMLKGVLGSQDDWHKTGSPPTAQDSDSQAVDGSVSKSCSEAVVSLINTAREYAAVCCSSLDGRTSFSRCDIMMAMQSVMADHPEVVAAHPEFESVLSDIFEQHKDLGHKDNIMKTEVYRTQYQRIRETAYATGQNGRSAMDDYVEGLRFRNGGVIDKAILDAEIRRLSELLAREMMNNYIRCIESDEEFATALYSLNYSLTATYRLYTRRMKRDCLMQLREQYEADTKALSGNDSVDEEGTQKVSEDGTQKASEDGTQKASEDGTQKASEDGTQKAAKANTTKPTKTAKTSKPKPDTAARADAAPKTLRYFRHGHLGRLKEQHRRVGLLLQKWSEWGWISPDTRAADFESLFEGEPRHCNIRWTGNTTTLTIMLQELLKQDYIEPQTNCKAPTMVRTQFGLTPNSDRSRLKQNEERIRMSIMILDTAIPIPKTGRHNDDEDEDDNPFADDVMAEVYSGGLRVTKGI